MEHQQTGNTPINEITAALQSYPDHPKARVSMRISHWGEHISVNCEVSLETLQRDDHVQRATEVAFVNATRFVNEATSRFDRSMPLLPTS